MLAAHLYRATQRKFGGSGYKALSSFLFTRFFFVVVSAPDSFGLLPGLGACAFALRFPAPTLLSVASPPSPPSPHPPILPLALSVAVIMVVAVVQSCRRRCVAGWRW
jgi:hypothetical protein